jgi:hypothetical protein
MYQYNQLDDGTHIYLITVATKPNANLEKLKEMCKYRGITIQVLGMNDSRPQGKGHGFGLKMSYLHQFCAQILRTDPNSLFVFIDAFDVMLVQSLQRLYEQYKLFDSDLVFSGEVFCHPDPERTTSFVHRHEQAYPFLNSGTFCGRVKTIYALLENHSYSITDDDQRYYTTLFLQFQHHSGLHQRHQIVLDTEASIFLCLAGSIWDLALNEHGEFINQQTKTKPSILHFNGCAELFPTMYQLYRQILTPPVTRSHKQHPNHELMNRIRPTIIIHPDRYYSDGQELYNPNDAFCHCNNWQPSQHGGKIWVECSQCQLWYHDYCFNITAKQLYNNWYCSTCL